MFRSSSPLLSLRLFAYGEVFGLRKRDDNLGVEEERSVCVRETPEPNTSGVDLVLSKPQNGGHNIRVEFTSYQDEPLILVDCFQILVYEFLIDELFNANTSAIRINVLPLRQELAQLIYR